jgi:hypothetical protein
MASCWPLNGASQKCGAFLFYTDEKGVYMLTQFIRIFKGAEDITDPLNPVITLTDMSMENAEKTGIDVNTKYIYIAQKFPFNNIFMLMSALVNTVSSKIRVEYWNHANGWTDAKDILDFTRGLRKHGLVQFQLDNHFSWDCIQETDGDDLDCPEEIKGKSINDCHWLRFSYDVMPINTAAVVDDPGTPLVDETAAKIDVQVKSFTYAFTTSEKVNAVDVQAKRYYETFATGKTDWQDEILIGSEMMIADLKLSKFIKSAGQIILLDDFVLPCAYRVLEHIYSQMGTAYDDKRGEVKALYREFMKGPKTLDADMDGRIKRDEQVSSSPRIYR